MSSRSSKKKNRDYLIRRRRARIIILVLVLLFFTIGFLACAMVASMPYETIDLCEYATVELDGYNTYATVSVTTDDVAIDALLTKVKSDYENAFFHNRHPQDADYLKFRQSLSFEADKTNGLANGSVVTVTGSYDEELAKTLKIEVNSTQKQITVGGLATAAKVSKEQIFEDLEVSFSGVSPSLQVYMSNKSVHPFVSRVGFQIIDPKEEYSVGDIIRIKANYSEELSRETQYIADLSSDECIKEYAVESETEYLSSAADLPQYLLDEAVDAGKKAFVDANEYGVRIYCEANLVPVYINKKATFVYGTPKYVSSYLKTIKPDSVGSAGYDYNDLDVIYSVVISQADGVKCTAYAAVRFTDIIKNADGSFEYDFSNPKILSESYFSDRVKKNVTENYESTHVIERVYANR